MKKFLILLTVLLLPLFMDAINLWAFLSYATFNSPEGPYVETYLTVAGNTVKYVKLDNGKFQATVNVLMTFKQNDAIKAFKKYELNSPEIADTTKTSYQFLDEQRFPVPNGTYDFEIQVTDKNKSAKPTPFIQTVTVDFTSDKPAFSGIQQVQSYTKSESEKTISKNGYDIIPYVYNYYPPVEKTLTFYCEIYNMDKVNGQEQKYLLSYYLESYENNLKMSEFTRTKKAVAKSVEPILAEFNIENLATGNYNLVVEARNQQNELIASKKLFFQRSNPGAKVVYSDLTAFNTENTFVDRINNSDTLKEDISCTFPISSGLERSFIKGPLKQADLKTLQQYFYGFWLRRDSQNPEKAWLAYREQVKKAQVNFGTPIKKGYQTDRGRVYLEYGAPNTRSMQYSEPSTYPYEIWQYYTLNNTQRNRKFVFYSPDMVTSDFFLLHSDANGEIHDPRWQIDLRSRTESHIDIGDTQTVNAWGDFSDDYWKLPN
jgi:GWxTD domain-containing protein